MNKIKTFILSLGLLIGLASPVAVSAAPLTQFAAKCSGGVMNFPAWYDKLECQGSQPVFSELNDFWIIGLNVVGMLIALVSYFSLGYIIWGGFKYIKSQGEAAAISQAKMAIIQAIAGLLIALGSFAIIRAVQGAIV